MRSILFAMAIAAIATISTGCTMSCKFSGPCRTLSQTCSVDQGGPSCTSCSTNQCGGRFFGQGNGLFSNLRGGNCGNDCGGACGNTTCNVIEPLQGNVSGVTANLCDDGCQNGLLGGGCATGNCGDDCATGDCGGMGRLGGGRLFGNGALAGRLGNGGLIGQGLLMRGGACDQAAGGCGDADCNGGCGAETVQMGSAAGFGQGILASRPAIGCGNGGCGMGGRLCGRCGLGARGASHPYGGQIPHTPAPAGMGGAPTPSYAYPYYTTRGPRDFLNGNPPSIGR